MMVRNFSAKSLASRQRPATDAAGIMSANKGTYILLPELFIPWLRVQDGTSPTESFN